MEDHFHSRRIELYASGTAALSRAIALCAARSSVPEPEVIIPAYSCPDLVAASLRACVFPRLVDTLSNGWSYDPHCLERSVSRNTVAIIAVNLLGIGDGSEQLSQYCQKEGIALIQDSAQYLPRAARPWPGDYAVLSFGRGKPMNLLHGGALVHLRSGTPPLPTLPVRQSGRDWLLSTRAAGLAFNVLTRPRLYGVVSTLPWIRVGKVTYQPLDHNHPLPDRVWRQVGAAYREYCDQPSYSTSMWTRALDEWTRFGIERLECPTNAHDPEAVRLAILVPDRAARDLLLDRLSRQGLGPSRLYGTTLNQVDSIPAMVRRQGPFANAALLADRLLTLPTHRQVDEHAVSAVRAVVSSWHRTAVRPD